MTTSQASDSMTRTTLTGKPIAYNHDSLSNVMTSDGGFSSAGANLLPPGYTDDSVVHIPIKMSDIQGQHPVQPQVEKKRSLFRKLSNAVSIKQSSAEEFKVVTMRRGDYLKYWAKGEDGKFLPSVVEPLEGRRKWVERQLEFVGDVRKA
ncbi:hypothetical protein LTR62_006140 [Meristemomyces frigidus]|uniref:Uncharacterized protein n=1 Tax=Meristemomyces frigidus TaxID=1508187 RepID=A0AAN7YQ55_9PEZI|nr:hypothetical protein LTR62_006140 [Meristemomyces frigidus]